MRPSFGQEHPFRGRAPFGDPRAQFQDLHEHFHAREGRGGVPFPPFPPGGGGPWPDRKSVV